MTDRKSIGELTESWKKMHVLRWPAKPRSKSIYFELQVVIIMVAVFSLYHYPPVLGLPHADVLILDMTHGENHSLSLFTSVLSQSHLSYLLYDSFTVNLVRLIPTGNYRFIILWGHSGLNDMATTEPYVWYHHFLEQLTGQVGRYLVQGNEYFSIRPGLVTAMKGTLHGSLVLLMGCNTLTQPDLARAFLEKGSSLVVGWTGLISVQVTNTFAVSLFAKMMQDHESTAQALAETGGMLAAMGFPGMLSSFGEAPPT